jgi:AraC-like DNA-binding protein
VLRATGQARNATTRGNEGAIGRVVGAVELLGLYSNRDTVTKFQRVLAGHGRDRPSARATRSPQRQRRLDDQEQAQLLAAYEQGVMINDLAAMFGLSRTAVMANLGRLGAESRRGVVDRRIEEARSLYESGESLATIGNRYGVNPSTVRNALLKAGVTMRPKPGSSPESVG